MSWNYRIVRHDDHGGWYAIHEVYYNSKGQICLISVDPDGPTGDTMQDLVADFRLQKEAFKFGYVKYDRKLAKPDWEDQLTALLERDKAAP